jgi:hypothetical protein
LPQLRPGSCCACVLPAAALPQLYRSSAAALPHSCRTVCGSTTRLLQHVQRLRLVLLLQPRKMLLLRQRRQLLQLPQVLQLLLPRLQAGQQV